MQARHWRGVAAFAAVTTLLAAFAGGAQARTDGGSGAAAAASYKVGIVYSRTGLLAAYGAEYIQGLRYGLAYATKGTMKVNGRPIELTIVDDGTDPTKAVAAGRDLIGKGYKILAGSVSSGVALQMAPLAAQNKVLFISGPAATDAVTGINKYTFRSGRQTYQDVKTAATFLKGVGKKVTVFAQDSAFGKANEAGVKAVLGAKGAAVGSVLVPSAATDFTPFATQVKGQAPDLLFVAWAGANATQMWTTLAQQGVFTTTKVVTGLDIKPTHALFGEAGDKIAFLSHFFAGAADNPEYQALAAGLKKGGQDVDLFTDDGFVAAQMVVRALSEGGDDVDKMVTALEGWKFAGPKGAMEIRAADHALLQPMFTAKLVKEGSGFVPQLVATLAPADVAPPAVTMK